MLAKDQREKQHSQHVIGTKMSGQLGEIGYFEDASHASITCFQDQIDRFLTRNDLDHYSFVQLRYGSDGTKTRDLNLQTNYDDDWISRYTHRRYDQIDPVCQLGRKASAPFWWGGARFLSGFEKRQRKVFWEAKEFGIVYGVSIPVRARDGDLGLVTFTAGSASDIQSILYQSGPALHVAAHQITDRLLERETTAAAEDSPLTPRERESLIWVVEGMTSEEIADRMFLSVSAVNYHLGKATRKLDARNRHHAALLAISRKLL